MRDRYKVFMKERRWIMIPPLALTSHVNERMAQRAICVADVANAIDYGKCHPAHGHNMAYHYRDLVVVVDRSHTCVVTAYRKGE